MALVATWIGGIASRVDLLLSRDILDYRVTKDVPKYSYSIVNQNLEGYMVS